MDTIGDAVNVEQYANRDDDDVRQMNDLARLVKYHMATAIEYSRGLEKWAWQDKVSLADLIKSMPGFCDAEELDPRNEHRAGVVREGRSVFVWEIEWHRIPRVPSDQDYSTIADPHHEPMVEPLLKIYTLDDWASR